MKQPLPDPIEKDEIIPEMKDGDTIDFWVEVTKVANGNITKSKSGEIRVYNSDINERAVSYIVTEVLKKLNTGDVMEISLSQKLIKKAPVEQSLVKVKASAVIDRLRKETGCAKELAEKAFLLCQDWDSRIDYIKQNGPKF